MGEGIPLMFLIVLFFEGGVFGKDESVYYFSYFTLLQQCLHDLCLVWSFDEYDSSALDPGRSGELGDSLV